MADPQTPVDARPSNVPAPYQPVAGTAVAAFAVAIIFALSLIGLVLIVLLFKRSLFSYSLLALPAGGIALSILARSQIRSSEGTRTGTGLAGMAWWICVVGGAGYGSYLAANSMFIGQQSETAARKFFDKLRDGKIREAFLETLDPALRNRANPDDPADFDVKFPEYAMFRNHQIIRMFARNGKDVKVESTGSGDLNQESGGYRIKQYFRLQAPEGLFTIEIPMVAAESKKGGKPVWRLEVAQSTFAVREFAPFGKVTEELDREADSFSKLYMQNLFMEQKVVAHMMTCDPQHGESLVQRMRLTSSVIGGVGNLMPVRRGVLPADRSAGIKPESDENGTTAIEDLLNIGFFKPIDPAVPLTTEKINQLRRQWAIRPEISPNMTLRPEPGGSPGAVGEMSTMVIEANRVIIEMPIMIRVGAGQHDRASGRLGLVADSPEFATKLKQVRDEGIGSKGDTALTLYPARKWRVLYVRSNFEPLPPPTMPGGPGGPGGGMDQSPGR